MNKDFVLVSDLVQIYKLDSIHWTNATLGTLVKINLLDGIKTNGNTYASEKGLKSLLALRNKQIKNSLHFISL